MPPMRFVFVFSFSCFCGSFARCNVVCIFLFSCNRASNMRFVRTSFTQPPPCLQQGNTALILAARGGNIRCVKTLLKAGAAAKAKNHVGVVVDPMKGICIRGLGEGTGHSGGRHARMYWGSRSGGLDFEVAQN